MLPRKRLSQTTNTPIAPPRKEISGLPGILIALGLAIVAVLVRVAFDPWLLNYQQIITLYGAVAAAAWISGWRMATLTAVAGYFALNYFITPPRSQFTFDSAAIASMIGAWLSCAFIIAFAAASRRGQMQAFEQQHEANRLAAIVESSADAIFSIDLQGLITSWNRGSELLYGYTSAEMVGRPLDLLIPRERKTEEQRILDTVRQGTTIDHYETTRLRKDGKTVFIALSVSAIRDGSGKIIGASKIARDITSRKQAEETLRRNEATLRTALEAGELGAWEWDIRSNQVTWTDRLYDFHGLPRGTFKGTVEAFTDLVHREDLPRVRQSLDGAMQDSAPYQLEFRAVRPDGEIRWLLTGGRVIRNNSGEAERMVGVTQDITERKRAEQRERRLTQDRLAAIAKFRAVFDQSSVFAGIMTLDGTLVEANRLSLETCGYRAEDVLQKKFWQTPWWRGNHALQEKLRQASDEAREGKFFRETLTYLWADGSEHAVDFALSPVRDEGGEVILIHPSGIDVTERIRAESALRESEGRFRGLIEQAPFSVQILAPTGRTVEVNRAWEELWGLTLPDVRNYNVLQDPQLAAKGVLPLLERAFQGEAVEIPAIQYDPEKTLPGRTRYPEAVRWVSAMAYPLRSEDGTVREVILVHQDITNRRRAEEALRASEERLRLITANTPALVSYLDRDLVYGFANETYLIWFNRTPEQVVGHSAVDVLGPEIFRDREPHMREALKGSLCRFEGPTHHHVLGLRFTEINYVPDRTPAGEVVGFYVFVNDIHDRKVAEQNLKTALAKLQAHFNNSPLAVIEWNDQWQVIQWSQGAERLFGIPASEAVGRLLHAIPIVHPDDAEHVAQVGRRLLSGAEPFVLSRNRNLARDGRVLHCEWYNTVVGRSDGGASALSLVLDVTDRTLAEEALRESEARFRQLADSMPQLVWTARSDGMVDYYNQRISAYEGAARGADGRWTWNALVHPEDLEATRLAWEQAVAKQSVYSVTHRIRMVGNQYRWHLSRALPVRDASGQVVRWFGTATDIDDQKRAEEKLEAVVAQRTAKLRETVADLEAFSYSIAHDMRAPLRSMSGYASILRTDYSSQVDAEGQNFLRRIETSAERLDRLIQDVLNYSKIVRGEMDLEPVKFGELAQDIIFSYSHLQEPHATIILAGPLPVVLANPAALTQVISNLLGNAVKFVAPGVKPRVHVRSEPGPAGFVRVWFEDNGIGIDPTAQQRIFHIFQRLNRPEQYDGTGIGLSIVRKAAERMGGRVGVESVPGQGSRFWVELRSAGGEFLPHA